jgi:hypothetical protein
MTIGVRLSYREMTMKRPPARAWAPALLVLSLILTTVSPAHAAPFSYVKDKTDNVFSFTYDAVSGTFTKAGSSALFKARDKVDFLVYIREHPEDVIGQRLKGRLQFGLIKDMTVIYDGTFTLDVFSPAMEDPIYTVSSVQRIVLRPKKGMRKAAIVFPFDLPSGENYSARATFQAS